jgi:hypothetical protein
MSDLLRESRGAARWNTPALLLAGLLVLQGFHMLEHTAQLVQYYALDLPPARAQGLLAALNVEWVHFIWNWLVWGCLAYLMARGWRTPLVWALIAWATLHALEHTYLLVRYLQVVAELRALGLPLFDSAEGLPGILGRNGWLAYSSFCGPVPGLSTAPRVAIHFGWNAGETLLLFLAAFRSASPLELPIPRVSRQDRA